MLLEYLQGITVDSLKAMFFSAFEPILEKLGMQADDKVIMIMLVVSGIIGVLHCLFGYKLLRLWIWLFGFICGFRFGWWFAGRLSVNPSTSLIVAAITGIAFSLVVTLVLKLGIFLFSTVIGGFAAVYILTTFIRAFEGEKTVLAIIVLASALAIGGIAVHFMRPVLIVLTALVGGIVFAAAIAVLLNLSQHIELFFAGGVIVAILGMMFQFSASED
ncbi:MAG: DUF4203 domain-containing protein [Lachnospiraceae bacterium]|nr:DUF4203 domain-containing protein [Lachnospiraceae bacterium]